MFREKKCLQIITYSQQLLERVYNHCLYDQMKEIRTTHVERMLELRLIQSIDSCLSYLRHWVVLIRYWGVLAAPCIDGILMSCNDAKFKWL